MKPLMAILGALIIGLASYSAEARGGGGHGGGRAMGHFAGRFGFHHFGFNRFAFRFAFNPFGFNRFAFNRFGGFNQLNVGRNWGWGYSGYGGEYGGDDYSYSAAPPNVVVLMPQPALGAALALPRGDLPPCREMSLGVVVERAMGCSVPKPTASAAPSQADNLTPSQAGYLTPSQADDLTPSQADDTPPSRAEYLPPCHEATPVGPVVDRGMACSRGSG